MSADELISIIKGKKVEELRTYLARDDVKKYVNTSASDGLSAIHCAVQTRNVVMLALLLAAGANPNREVEAVGPHLGYTAAHYAASNGDVEILQLLFDYKADFNRHASDHWYPLHLSVFKNKHNATVFLVEHGADVNRTNNKGQTALMFAVSHGRTDDVRFLIKNKANLKFVDANKDTLMHHALHYQLSKLFDNTYNVPECQLDVAVILATSGCSANELNASGESATHYLQEKLPTLSTVLTLLVRFAPLFMSAAKEWNYLSLLSATVDYLQSIGFVHDDAEVLCSNVAKLERERQMMKAGTLPESVSSSIDKETKLNIPANHPQVSLTELAPGSDPSGGKCPFFQRQRANNAIQNGMSKETVVHALSDKQHKTTANNTDDGRPLCPFSLAFIYRHRNTLLLLGLAFVSGMWADQLVMNVLKSSTS